MKMYKPLAYIFEAIDKSDVENKADLMRDVWFGILTFFSYFRSVGESNIYYSNNLQEKLNIEWKNSLYEQRTILHDEVMFYCTRLNEICFELNIKRLCDFDLEDRAKVAQFCGYIVCSLYFGNIKEDVAVNEWMSSFPLVKGD